MIILCSIICSQMCCIEKPISYLGRYGRSLYIYTHLHKNLCSSIDPSDCFSSATLTTNLGEASIVSLGEYWALDKHKSNVLQQFDGTK